MGAAAAASPGKQHEATASLHKMAEDDMDMPDWDDEDLLAMQAEPMVCCMSTTASAAVVSMTQLSGASL